jgi:heme/copper-type cytochrome/quinol oxidase subunit 2
MRKVSAIQVLKLIVPVFALLVPLIVMGQAPRVINITATSQNKFQIAGQKEPVITAKPGEVLKLHITAFKGPEFEKDGTAHTITINEFKEQGWNIRLKEGVKDYTVVAPDKPGEYESNCDVKCGKGHDDMKVKLIVKG